MRSIQNAVLSFGLVTVPVGIGGAVSESKGVSFKLLHVDCSTPVKMPRFCPVCEEKIEAEDIVKGFEYAKGQYLVFTDEELDAVKPDKSKVIRINKFVPDTSIPMEWVDKNYVLIPTPILGTAYSTLLQSMMLTEKMGLGYATLWGKESVCVVWANSLNTPTPAESESDLKFQDNAVLMFSTLHPVECHNKIDFTIPDASDAEVAMGVQMLNAWGSDVEPEDLTVASNEELSKLIASKLAKTPYVTPAAEPMEPTPDLLEALRASIEAGRDKVPA